LSHLRAQGFRVEEGKSLRGRHKHVSGPKAERAADFLRFWRDPEVRAIMPPWGGELLVEILPLLDFAELGRSDPKWVSGYSDLSTLMFPLTLRTGVATVHGANLMDLAPTQTDPLTTTLVSALQLSKGAEITQRSVPLYQSKWLDFETHVDAPLNLTEKTEWKGLKGESSLRFSGRMIGGCLDTIARLVGTPYGDLPGFVKQFAREGVILYLENCELPPCEVARTLWNLRLAGWFEGISGLLIGRSAGPEATSAENLSYVEALQSVLGDLKIPVVYDADIGHRPPQFNIVNGSLGTVEFAEAKGKLTQRLI
jgi:muramoyltetrapeptide carboxypeptidase